MRLGHCSRPRRAGRGFTSCSREEAATRGPAGSAAHTHMGGPGWPGRSCTHSRPRLAKLQSASILRRRRRPQPPSSRRSSPQRQARPKDYGAARVPSLTGQPERPGASSSLALASEPAAPPPTKPRGCRSTHKNRIHRARPKTELVRSSRRASPFWLPTAQRLGSLSGGRERRKEGKRRLACFWACNLQGRPSDPAPPPSPPLPEVKVKRVSGRAGRPPQHLLLLLLQRRQPPGSLCREVQERLRLSAEPAEEEAPPGQADASRGPMAKGTKKPSRPVSSGTGFAKQTATCSFIRMLTPN